MKKLILIITGLCAVFSVLAQDYPEPEFTNEVYFLKKDSIYSVVRLEKGSSKMESKVKMGGLGGAESGYELGGTKSDVRLPSGRLSFVFSNGISVKKTDPQSDSMMRANGIDPSMMSGMSMGMGTDPSNSITLYKIETGKGKRKVLLQGSPGAISFKKKSSSSDKYTFSVKKIREGYWELVIDKPLPRGEYSFVAMSFGSMDGSSLLFAFGID